MTSQERERERLKMHIEIQVALNFVISYLYNKLPRRRVNIFGEELEKALKHKFQGHWYIDKPFKGSAFRCLKTGEPIDVVLEIAARESGVPIGDILENLPAELSVWVDPGEVSYRIGEKGAVKILYSEQKHDSPDDNNADREVTTTFNPEAQCFRPIEILSSSLNGISLSPKGSPSDSSPTSSTSPMYNKNNSPLGTNGTNTATATFLGRQEPVLFTTATFAQTKFGSTKLKNNSKRTNRMSPTEFSNYIKQRQQLQQHNNHYHPNNHHQGNLFGAIGSISPARSISPNPMTLQMANDSSMHQNPFVFPSSANGFNGLNMYQSFGSPRNMFDAALNSSGGNNGNNNSFNQFNGNNDPLVFTPNKCSSFMDQQSNFCKIPSPQQQQQQTNSQSPSTPQASLASSSNSLVVGTNSSSNNSVGSSSNQQQQSDSSKLLDGMNSFYNNNSNSSYQHHLLVAN